jgi:CheY-like chemotaxis protein
VDNGHSSERWLSVALILALVDDIFFRARISETAKQLGVEIIYAGSPEALSSGPPPAPGGGGEAPYLILVDLNSRGDVIGALHRLQSMGNQTPVVAFLSHVQTELAERARAAGCSDVMPRSKFTQDLAAILSRAM